jgi:hypothetical protein
MHLTDLFAQVAGVELVDGDWTRPAKFAPPATHAVTQMDTSVFAAINGVQAPIVIHLGGE